MLLHRRVLQKNIRVRHAVGSGLCRDRRHHVPIPRNPLAALAFSRCLCTIRSVTASPTVPVTPSTSKRRRVSHQSDPTALACLSTD